MIDHYIMIYDVILSLGRFDDLGILKHGHAVTVFLGIVGVDRHGIDQLRIERFSSYHHVFDAVFTIHGNKLAVTVDIYTGRYRSIDGIGKSGYLNISAAFLRIKMCAHFKHIQYSLTGNLHHADRGIPWEYSDHFHIINIAGFNVCTDASSVDHADIGTEFFTIGIGKEVTKIRLYFTDQAVACLRIIDHQIMIGASHLHEQIRKLFFDRLHHLIDAAVFKISVFFIGQCIDQSGLYSKTFIGHGKLQDTDPFEFGSCGSQKDRFTVLVFHDRSRNLAVSMAVKEGYKTVRILNDSQ